MQKLTSCSFNKEYICLHFKSGAQVLGLDVSPYKLAPVLPGKFCGLLSKEQWIVNVLQCEGQGFYLSMLITALVSCASWCSLDYESGYHFLSSAVWAAYLDFMFFRKFLAFSM